MEKGLILKGIGGLYEVESESGLILSCKARGVFRNKAISPLPGDRVALERETEDTGVIVEILQRKNELKRPPLSNLDQLVFITSITEPRPNPLILDKLIAIAEFKKIEPIIVITKVDLASGKELQGIYKQAGFRTFMLSNFDKASADEIKVVLEKKISAFTGNSGVGKSSLLNNIDPRLGLETAEISQKLGRGKHTTRHVELFKLDNGGYVADTPGFSALDTERYEIILKDDLQYCFREFQPYLGQCRFNGCSHTTDKGCAVLAALERGEISLSRHTSYCAMYDEAKKIKEWEYTSKKETKK